ncbi:MAG: hypothetical protein H6Q66_654 [Firmicutes bacterium]|nr:hypothetical protein [Bacillota bacterium]
MMLTIEYALSTLSASYMEAFVLTETGAYQRGYSGVATNFILR